MPALARLVLAAALALAAAASALAGAYPERPVRIIVPFAPGGASDFIARIVAARCREALGQPCVIENVSGASGNTGMEAAARAASDGYTVFLGNVGTVAINPHLYRSLKIDPAHAFVPVTQLASIPGMLVAHPSLPADTPGELIEHARRNPGRLNYGSPGAGSGFRILMELLKKQAAVDIVEVPYKGGAGPAVAGLVAGDTQIAFATVASVEGFVKSGRLKALAVITSERLPAYPAVPTLAEAGFPRIVENQWQGIFVPRGTPKEIVARLHGAMTRILGKHEVRERLAASAARAEPSPSPGEFGAFVGRQSRHWAQIVADVGASVE
jgi:tripartite-type tricarboxylate transporter receptor subunit TctC